MIMGMLIACNSACNLLVKENTPIPTAIISIENEPTATIDWFPATATPTQRTTSQPEPSPTTFNPKEALGELIFEDDFSKTNLWQTSKTVSGNTVYGESSLSLAVAGNKSNLTSLSPYTLPQDFFLELSASVSLCQYGDQYGILFWHLSSGDTYRLVVTCDGRLRLELISGSGGTVLQDWTYASRMIPGAPAEHLIGIWVWNGVIYIFINGVSQFEVKTTTDRSGGLGVYARAAGDTAMTVGISQLKVFNVNQAP